MPRSLERVHLDVVHAANAGLRTALGSTAETRPFLCECSDAGCVRRVELTAAGYDELRLSAEPRVLHPVCAVRGDPAPLDAWRLPVVERGRSRLRRLLRREP